VPNRPGQYTGCQKPWWTGVDKGWHIRKINSVKRTATGFMSVTYLNCSQRLKYEHNLNWSDYGIKKLWVIVKKNPGEQNSGGTGSAEQK